MGNRESLYTAPLGSNPRRGLARNRRYCQPIHRRGPPISPSGTRLRRRPRRRPTVWFPTLRPRQFLILNTFIFSNEPATVKRCKIRYAELLLALDRVNLVSRIESQIAGNRNPAKAPGGRRESNKSDKLRRIKEAARSYFLTRNFDQATTRDIAARAGVALGTLFTYASDKRDLLFLAINDDLDEIIETAERTNQPDKPLVDNFLAVFALFYRYFARHPHLSRLLLREMIFYESGEQAGRFLASREKLLALTALIIRQSMERAHIKADESPEFVGWLVFSIYQAEVRRWLRTEKPSFRAGIARLRRALVIFTNGVHCRN
jgi:AcrR family transcriptional regulator